MIVIFMTQIYYTMAEFEMWTQFQIHGLKRQPRIIWAYLSLLHFFCAGFGLQKFGTEPDSASPISFLHLMSFQHISWHILNIAVVSLSSR